MHSPMNSLALKKKKLVGLHPRKSLPYIPFYSKVTGCDRFWWFDDFQGIVKKVPEDIIIDWPVKLIFSAFVQAFHLGMGFIGIQDDTRIRRCCI